jgi:hypothetical protein
MTKRIAIYARTSTADDQSTENQIFVNCAVETLAQYQHHRAGHRRHYRWRPARTATFPTIPPLSSSDAMPSPSNGAGSAGAPGAGRLSAAACVAGVGGAGSSGRDAVKGDWLSAPKPRHRDAHWSDGLLLV